MLEYNDEAAQEKKEMFYVFDLGESEMTENGLNLGISLDLMKI